MKKSMIDKYARLKARRKFTTHALGIFGGMVAVVGGATYYGSQVGNFVISVDQTKTKSIALALDDNFEDASSRIVAKPLKDCVDACYQDIPSNIEEGMGSKNDPDGRFLAYSFYLVNVGTATTNVTMNVNILEATKNIDSILRVMVIQDGETVFYAKAKDSNTDEVVDSSKGEPIWGITIDGIAPLYETVAFDHQIVCARTYNDFRMGESMKFTIVMWLDGFDEQNPDGNKEMLGAALKTEVKFSVVD